MTHTCLHHFTHACMCTLAMYTYMHVQHVLVSFNIYWFVLMTQSCPKTYWSEYNYYEHIMTVEKQQEIHAWSIAAFSWSYNSTIIYSVMGHSILTILWSPLPLICTARYAGSLKGESPSKTQHNITYASVYAVLHMWSLQLMIEFNTGIFATCRSILKHMYT